jgi:predicted nucleic acid-binding protein
MRVICNTTPLIALSSVGKSNLLKEVFSTVTLPKAVVDEIEVGGKIDVPDLRDTKWIQIAPNIETIENRLLYQLDYGERQVVLNALKLNADLLIIDDRVARNIAEHLALHVKGTLGVLVIAKQKGLITSFRDLALKMRDNGIYFSKKLIYEISYSIGEK